MAGDNVWVTVTFPGPGTASDTASRWLVSPFKDVLAGSSAIKVYPNPAGGSTRLELPESGPGGE